MGNQCVAYVDFRKAFSKVPYNKFLSKLENIRIAGPLQSRSKISLWVADKKQEQIPNDSSEDQYLVECHKVLF